MNKWCNRCGHEARTFYDVKVLSESHICADCVLELMGTDPTCEIVMKYIKKVVETIETPTAWEQFTSSKTQAQLDAMEMGDEYPDDDAARCDVCGDRFGPHDEIGEFVDGDKHVVAHSECGLSNGLAIA